MQTYIDILLQLVIKMKVWNNCIKRSFDYRKTTIKNVDSAYIGKLRGGDWEICNNTMIETNAGRSNNKKQKKKMVAARISARFHRRFTVELRRQRQCAEIWQWSLQRRMTMTEKREEEQEAKFGKKLIRSSEWNY